MKKKNSKSAAKSSILSAFPYDSYDVVEELYHNVDTSGFILISPPALKLNEFDLRHLNTMIAGVFKTGATLQVSIVSTSHSETKVSELLPIASSEGLRSEVLQRLLESSRRNAENLKDSQTHGVVPKNFHLIISYAVRSERGPGFIEQLTEARSTMKARLTVAGIRMSNLDPDRFRSIVQHLFHSKPSPLEKWSIGNSILSGVFGPEFKLSLSVDHSTVNNGAEELKVLPYHVSKFPKGWRGGQAADLLGSFTESDDHLPANFIITLSMIKPPQEKIKLELREKARTAHFLNDSFVAKLIPKVIAERLGDLTFVQDRVDQGDTILETTFQVLLFPRFGEYDRVDEGFRNHFRSIGWELKRSRYLPLESIASALPLGISQSLDQRFRKLHMYKKLPSWTCAQIAPWQGEWKGRAGKGTVACFGRRGQVASWSPHGNADGNFNVWVNGLEKSGKTAVVSQALISLLGSGGKAIVIDSKGSYTALCALLGGQVVDLGDFPSFNPFAFVCQDADTESWKDSFPEIRELLLEMVGVDERSDVTGTSFLSEVLKAVLIENGKNTTIDLIIEKCLTPECRAVSPGNSDKLAERLAPYAKEGKYGRYFVGEPVKFEKAFTIIQVPLDTQGSPHLPVLIQAALIQFRQAFQIPPVKGCMVVFDDCTKILSGIVRSGLLEECMRTARLSGISYVCVGRSLTEWGTLGIAKRNCHTTLHFQQCPFSLAEMVKAERISGPLSRVLAEARSYQGFKAGRLSVSYEAVICDSDGEHLVRFHTDDLFKTIPKLNQESLRGLSASEAVNELEERAKVDLSWRELP